MSVLRRFGSCLLVLAAFAAAGVKTLQATTIAARIEKDTITVVAEGVDPKERFALVFSRAAGSIVGWYDLDRDPKMKVNLCARGGANSFALFQNRAEVFTAGKKVPVLPGKADEFALVESSDVRVVVRMKGPFTTPSGELPDEDFGKTVQEFTGREPKHAEWPRYSTRFTVYPTGRIYVRHVWELKGWRPIILSSNRAILGTAPAREVEALNDHPAGSAAYLRPASFILHHGKGDDFGASALLVADYRRYPTDWLGQLVAFDNMRRGSMRSGFLLRRGEHLMKPGKYVWHFMLQVEPSSLHSREAAAPYVGDYLKPARITFLNRHGSADITEGEDEQMDGFAEGRGCYVVSAAGVRHVEMRMDCGMQTRFHPVFEIDQWQHDLPGFITVDGRRRHVGVHYNLRLDKKTLVVQYLGTLSPGEHVIDLRAPEGAP